LIKIKDKKMKKKLLVSFGILLIWIVMSIVGSVLYTKIFPSKLPVPINVRVVNESYEIELIKADLETYGTISSKVENIIIANIKDVHEKLGIPIGLLHCIFRVESEYRFNIDHPEVTVSVGKHTIKTHAIGLGGVMWCYWGDSLKAHKIAEKEFDLYLPDVNIQASGYILSVMIKEAIQDDIADYGILDKIIRRYYGAYSEIYMVKMQKITSDLWLHRIAKDILHEYTRN
jgi:hypothetical protein